MALRSGYKGFKKLAAGLKEFWPGVLGVDIPALNKTFVDWSSYAETGAKNFLQNKGVSKESGGTTYTINSDGSISLSGTPTGNSGLDLNSYTGAQLKAMGKFLTLSGGISQKAYLILRLADWSMVIQSRTDEQTVDTSTLTDGTTYYISAAVETGADISGKKFYPMLRLASNPDPTFVPFAMTNEELTKNIAPIMPVVLGNNDNLNDITKMGVYIVAGLPTNTPDNKGFYALLVYPVANDGQSVIQVALHGENAIYYRRRSGSPISWKTWVKVEGTALS